MEQLTPNVRVETQRRGANHGLVRTSQGYVLVDTPYKPSDALRLRAEIEAEGVPLRYIVNTEPHGDHWTGNAFFDAPVIGHEGVRARMVGYDMVEHLKRVAAFGPDEPALVADYQARPPTITFTDGLTLHLGETTFRILGMPGHTRYQAAVIVEEEGVVFTSDNLFSGVHTWLHEGDPDRWYIALDRLRALDQEVFVPGHGKVAGKAALDSQEAFIREWVDYVRTGIDRGLSRDEAMDELTALTDRFPMDVEQEGMAPSVMRRNVANLYDFHTRQGIHAAG
jgi:cyclase